MIEYNIQRFKNGDVVKARFKSYSIIVICFVVFSILLFINTFTLNEIKHIEVVFLIKQLLFFLIGLIMILFIHVSFHLSTKEILTILSFLVVIISFLLLTVFKTNIFSSNTYIFVISNLHYYLIILSELTGTLIFKLFRNKCNQNIS